MELYQNIFEHTPDALFVVSKEGRIVDCNPRAAQLFGRPREAMWGQPIESLLPDRFAATHGRRVSAYFSQAHVRTMGMPGSQVVAKRADGSEFAADIMLSPLFVEEEMFALAAVRDISALKAVENELRQRTAELERLRSQLEVLASRDNLTGLLNRRAFEEHVDWLLRASARRREPLSMLMIDLDHFKLINDRFGHAEGDRALAAVGRVLSSHRRGEDVSARWGGEEFAVVLPATDAAGACIVAENLRRAIASAPDLPCPLTASFGAMTLPPDAAPPASTARLAEAADRALYTAKREGRDRVCHADRLPPP